MQDVVWELAMAQVLDQVLDQVQAQVPASVTLITKQRVPALVPIGQRYSVVRTWC